MNSTQAKRKRESYNAWIRGEITWNIYAGLCRGLERDPPKAVRTFHKTPKAPSAWVMGMRSHGTARPKCSKCSKADCDCKALPAEGFRQCLKHCGDRNVDTATKGTVPGEG